MLIRLLKADLKRGSIVALTLAGLIGLAAMLTTASTALIVDTLAATSRLQERSKVPDLIQMHACNIDDQGRKAIDDWVPTRSDITAYDVLKTLPAPRQDLWIAGKTKQRHIMNRPLSPHRKQSIYC